MYCNSHFYSTDPVTCTYPEECVLLCKSTYHNIIHWYKGETPVHSFYQGKDQLTYQNAEYKGRTSLLSPSEINEGNVSLLLRPVRIQDEGKYKCYAANEKSNEEKFVDVSVIGEKQHTQQNCFLHLLLSLFYFKVCLNALV